MQQRITVTNVKPQKIVVSNIDHQEISVSNSSTITVVQAPSEVETYVGDYEVTPNFEGTTLQTKGKVLSDDIEVEPINVQRVSNLSGGRTVYIGGTING